MEQKRSGEQIADKLQDAAVQDPTIRTSPELIKEWIHQGNEKIIVHKIGSQRHGTLLPNQDVAHWTGETGSSIHLSDDSSGAISEVSLLDAKAVFFVRSFAATSKHQDLRFYDDQAEVPFLWTRITFIDGEVLECLVPNSSDLVLRDGFFAWSVDPESNNLAMYLVKKMIKDCQVLAIRHFEAEA
jgi:hypothetical protein